MSIDLVFKIAAIGILVSVLAQVLTRAGREEIATLATVAGILLVLFIVVNLAGELIAQVEAVFHLP